MREGERECVWEKERVEHRTAQQHVCAGERERAGVGVGVRERMCVLARAREKVCASEKERATEIGI